MKVIWESIVGIPSIAIKLVWGSRASDKGRRIPRIGQSRNRFSEEEWGPMDLEIG